ncbi:hypothetical protein D3C75_1080060 [compost metagenome]
MNVGINPAGANVKLAVKLALFACITRDSAQCRNFSIFNRDVDNRIVHQAGVAQD